MATNVGIIAGTLLFGGGITICSTHKEPDSKWYFRLGMLCTVAGGVKMLRSGRVGTASRAGSAQPSPVANLFMERFGGKKKDPRRVELKFTVLNESNRDYAKSLNKALKEAAKVKTESEGATAESASKTFTASFRMEVSNLLSRYTKKEDGESTKRGDATEVSKKEEIEVPQGPITYVFDWKTGGRKPGFGGPDPIMQFRTIVNFLVTQARPEQDEVLVRIRSPGGAVAVYGLLASLLERITSRKIPLTTSIDEVGASGGYLMASVSDKILAAPWAYVGSIGVVVELPNVSRALEKNDVQWEQIYAGEHKRSISPFAPVTKEGRDHTQDKVNTIHSAFRDHVKNGRAEKVGSPKDWATGEVWSGREACGMGLVDDVITSDEYLHQQMQAGRTVVEICSKPPKDDLVSRFGMMISSLWPENAVLNKLNQAQI